MKKLMLIMSFVLAAWTALPAQSQKKSGSPAGGPSTAAGKICDDPYQLGEAKDGWPEAPVYILFHRANSKAPWAPNPAIRVPGIQAASPGAARTLVCVEESQIEMGKYDSGEPGYSPSWDVTLVRLPDRKAYFIKVGFYGKEPPGIKFNRGAGVGARPTKIFADWLPLVVNQKVARFKSRYRPKEIHQVRAMVFSGDGARLAISQQARSTLDGTPPSPVTVIDVATGKTVATWNIDYLQGGLAISQAGDMVALGHDGHPEIWDVATAKLARKLEISGVDSLVFGPNDQLGVAGGGNATIWDVKNNRSIATGKGTRVALSPAGEWLAINADTNSMTVQTLPSGRAVATFPGVSKSYDYALAGDDQSMVRGMFGGAVMVATGTTLELSTQLPNLGVNMISAFAAARDGFVFGNDDGVVGLASVRNPQARVFATDQSAIRALAVSQDNKLVAVGDSSGVVTIWELR